MHNFRHAITTAALTGALLAGSLAGPVTAAEEVNIYSYRQPELVDELFAAFTKDTGIAASTSSW